MSVDDRIFEQLQVTRVAEFLGSDNIYPGDERLGATIKLAFAEAKDWVETNERGR